MGSYRKFDLTIRTVESVLLGHGASAKVIDILIDSDYVYFALKLTGTEPEQVLAAKDDLGVAVGNANVKVLTVPGQAHEMELWIGREVVPPPIRVAVREV